MFLLKFREDLVYLLQGNTAVHVHPAPERTYVHSLPRGGCCQTNASLLGRGMEHRKGWPQRALSLLEVHGSGWGWRRGDLAVELSQGNSISRKRVGHSWDGSLQDEFPLNSQFGDRKQALLLKCFNLPQHNLSCLLIASPITMREICT